MVGVLMRHAGEYAQYKHYILPITRTFPIGVILDSVRSAVTFL
jgi:Xaa-Pro aminopeptidase